MKVVDEEIQTVSIRTEINECAMAGWTLRLTDHMTEHTMELALVWTCLGRSDSL